MMKLTRIPVPVKPGTKRPAKVTTKQRRETVLLDELQRDHGYMFARLANARDSYTTQVHHGVKSGELAMNPARVLRVIVPDASILAEHADLGRKLIGKKA